MKDSKVLKTLLVISGLIASGFGAVILTSPVWLYTSSGISLDVNASILSEIRAPGGALLAMGLLIMAGAFVRQLTLTAVVISITVYLAYGLSRLMSIVIDGMPVESLVQAAVLELFIGIVFIFVFAKYRDEQNTPMQK